MELLYDAILKNILAIITAAVAITVGFISYKNFLLAKTGFNNKKSSFTLYLIESYRLINKQQENRKFLLFHITVSNKSENKNSYKAVLYLEYIREDNSVEKILLQHNPDLKIDISKNELSTFTIDIRIEEKSSQSKWLIFEQPKTINREYRLDKYTVAFKDVNNVEEQISAHLLKDIFYEEED